MASVTCVDQTATSLTLSVELPTDGGGRRWKLKGQDTGGLADWGSFTNSRKFVKDNLQAETYYPIGLYEVAPDGAEREVSRTGGKTLAAPNPWHEILAELPFLTEAQRGLAERLILKKWDPPRHAVFYILTKPHEKQIPERYKANLQEVIQAKHGAGMTIEIEQESEKIKTSPYVPRTP